MGAFSRIRYVIAANVNSLIEKAEDPEKLLRALIREMEDASEDARMACAELLGEQLHLERLEGQLSAEIAQWQRRAENAVTQGRDDLARTALQARAEITIQHESTVLEQQLVKDRVVQMEQDMLTLKAKLADAKIKLKGMHRGKDSHTVAAEKNAGLTPGEKKIRRAMGRFDRLQTQVENLEARVRSYEVGGRGVPVWDSESTPVPDPLVEEELENLKKRIRRSDKKIQAAPIATETAKTDEPAQTVDLQEEG